jgi:hypothetical protein
MWALAAPGPLTSVKRAAGPRFYSDFTAHRAAKEKAMHASAPGGHGAALDAPLATFSHCHAEITAQLEALAGLPALVETAQRAREVARGTMALFRAAVLSHHGDEERELFPAVLRSAAPGEERERVHGMIERLTSEHRALEALWKRLEPAVDAVAHGRPVAVEAGLAQHLVRGYLEHARFEEQQFLPLAETILRRNGNHMAALGLSLHLRHAPPPVGYI